MPTSQIWFLNWEVDSSPIATRLIQRLLPSENTRTYIYVYICNRIRCRRIDEKRECNVKSKARSSLAISVSFESEYYNCNLVVRFLDSSDERDPARFDCATSILFPRIFSRSLRRRRDSPYTDEMMEGTARESRSARRDACPRRSSVCLVWANSGSVVTVSLSDCVYDNRLNGRLLNVNLT